MIGFKPLYCLSDTDFCLRKDLSNCELTSHPFWFKRAFSVLKDTHREKTVSAYLKYEYGHLDLWYIKLTLYKRFLNRNKIFTK